MGGPHSRNVLLLGAGQFVAGTGEALFLVAMQWLAARRAADDTFVGLVVFMVAVPRLLFGPVAGAWVDRADRRRVMIASDLSRAALLFAAALLAGGAENLPISGLLVLAFLVGSCASPFLPARDALLPDLVAGGSLTRWNGALQTTWQIAQILGLCVGGALLAAPVDAAQAEGVGWVVPYAAATFLLSACALAAIRVPPVTAPTRPCRRLRAEMREGFAWAMRDPVVRPLLVLTALNNLAIMGPAIVGATLLVRDTFGLGPGHLAWLEGTMAAGMVVGSLVLARFGDRLRPSRLMLAGMVLDGLTYLPFAILERYETALPLIALHGAFIPAIVVGRTVILQRWVPPERRGQTFALVSMAVTGMTALSSVASGWIAERTSPGTLFALAGTLGAACGVAGWLWVRGRLDTTS